MARARNIKPDFFKDDELASLDPLARLLFIGLWTVADFNGRLEYRPKRIKAELLPYDECDINKLIDSLCESLHVITYRDLQNNKKTYIEIRNFTKHQHPHPHEIKKGTDIPSPNECNTQVTDLNNNITSNYNAITSNDAAMSNPSDSFNLIPYNTLSIADDFQPSDEVKQRALLAMVPEKIVNNPDEVLKFISHHKSKGTVSKNWNEEFFKWLMNAKVFEAKRGNSNAANKPGDAKRETAVDRHERASEEFFNSLDESGVPGGDGLVVGTVR